MRRTIKIIGGLCAGLTAASLAPFGCSYSSAYKNTAPGTLEIKTIPPSKTLVSAGKGQYFDGANGLFMNLFRFIQENDVAMTIPVEASIDSAAMTFYVGPKDLDKSLASTDKVIVRATPERLVVSKGVRGAYTEANFEETRDAVLQWLSENKEYRQIGPAYAVYWNSPFVLWFLKKAEVHVPIAHSSSPEFAGR